MAGNTRFHSKFHYAQHHSEVTSKNTTYPDATTDPIASEALPFQGDFHSDGVLKVTALDATRFNYFGNDVHVDSNLRVTNNTTISGDLEVVGNVVLKANPAYSQAQRIQIGDDKGGVDQIVDLVSFLSYVDSDFTPDAPLEHNLGEPDKRWWNLYVTNINLDGEFKVGTCQKDGDSTDKGIYINAGSTHTLGRVGINTCDPSRELDLVGDAEIHGDVKIDENKTIYWDSTTDNKKTAGITASNPGKLTIEHPTNLEIKAPQWSIQSMDVDIYLNNSQNALTIGDCLTHYDELNNRVGIHTCTPAVELDVVGNYQLTGDTSKSYINQQFLVESDDQITLKSTGITTMTAVDDMSISSSSNDINLQSPKTIQSIAKDVVVAAQSSITSTAGSTTIFNSPTLLTSGKRLLFTADTFTQLTTPTFDIDAPEIDLTTQDTSVVLIDSQHALDVHNCMLKLDTTNRHVGVNVCSPTVELDVAGDVLFTTPNSMNVDSSDVINLHATNVTTITSDNYTNITSGNVGFAVTDPVYRVSIPCGDKIGTYTVGTPASGSYIEFCSGTENVRGTRDMIITNNNSSDIVIDPGRSVVLPTTNLGVNMVPRAAYSLDLLGDTHLDGNLITTGTVIDKTLLQNRVMYKDDVTEQNTTTDEFYYDGIRAAIGHIPNASENAMLYVSKGPVKLASTPDKEMLIQSTSDVVVDDLGTTDKTLIRTPVDHSMVLDIPHTSDTSTFSIAFRDQTTALGVYDSSALETKFYIRPRNSADRAFFGFNTTSQSVTNDSSGFTAGYDMIINQDVNVVNDLRVGNDLHVEDNTTVDGKLTVNSENETTGVEVRSTNGARMDLVDTIGGIDYKYELQSHKNMSPGEIPGSGSTHGSIISNATNDHLVLDLRNTSEDHRFAVRYSSDNSGVSDKIVISAGHYSYNVANPNYDPSVGASSSNPQQIAETRQGHVGINCIPTQDYHLDVNGNMRITGNFVVDGASTQIQAANLEVEDKNITLNITPGGTSTTASTFNAGLLILGDNNDVVGYMKVHPNNVDQLVAKAPLGQELVFDINGATNSTLRLEASVIDHKLSTHTSVNSQITTTNTVAGFNDSTISLDNTGITAKDSSLTYQDNSTTNMYSGSTFTVGAAAQLHAEPNTISRINQDLTTDSQSVRFDGLYVSGAMTLPSANGAVASWSGSVRFNQTTKMFEGNVGTHWVPLNGWLADNDGDTYIKTKDTGAVDNDEIEFYVDGELVMFMNKNKAEFTTKYGFTVPSGDTASRPGASIVQPGEFRFNTEHKYYEGYDGDTWLQVGGVIDRDRDTYWTAHNDNDANDYPGDPDKLRAFAAGGKTLEIGSNNVKFFNAGTQHLDITSPADGFTRFTSTGMIDLNPGGDVNIHQHGAGKGLRLANELVTSSAGELNLNDITTVGQSQNNKVVTQSQSGVVTIGQAGGNQTLNVASHDLVDGGLKLGGTLVTSSAAELNVLDGITSSTKELNYLDVPALVKNDMVKLAAITASASELNTMDGITANTAELNTMDGITASTAELNKMDGVTATNNELNYVDVTSVGHAQANKALVVDQNKILQGLNYLYFNNTISGPTGSFTTVTGGTGNFSGNLNAGGSISSAGSITSTGSVHGAGLSAGSSGVYTTGNITSTGNAYIHGEVHSSSTSDIKLKDNLKVISDPMLKLSKINGYEFDWNEHDERSGQHDIGVVAQEVQQALPEIVEEKSNNTLGVKYDKMIPLLVECIKDQQKQIDELKKLVAEK